MRERLLKVVEEAVNIPLVIQNLYLYLNQDDALSLSDVIIDHALQPQYFVTQRLTSHIRLQGNIWDANFLKTLEAGQTSTIYKVLCRLISYNIHLSTSSLNNLIDLNDATFKTVGLSSIEKKIFKVMESNVSCRDTVSNVTVENKWNSFLFVPNLRKYFFL